MPTTRDLPSLPSTTDFAGWMRLAVQYDGHGSTMPLLQLDRRGLTVAVHDDADAPVIGLPRRAEIVSDSSPLCELRLVARSLARPEGQPMMAVLQPSRANDHAALWQALLEHRRHLGGAPACLHAAQLPALDSSATDLRFRVSCDAAFALANHEDACFFSHWLDYHFAELRARARMSDAAADLREIFLRVADHEVDVRFVFHAGVGAVRASSETASRWIAEQAARQLGMTVEHWLPGIMTTYGSPAGWPLRAVMTSRAGHCSPSSN